VGASKIARDITERRCAQETTAASHRRDQASLENTLATVQSIALQTQRSTSAEERQAFVGPLRALAGAHDLVALESWNRASVYDVVSRALATFQEDDRERFMISGPRDVWLNASKSLLLAMALYELGTDAVKYGALSNGSGTVRVEWELLRGAPLNRLKLCWREAGGPSVKPPEHNGFRSRPYLHIGSGTIDDCIENGSGSRRRCSRSGSVSTSAEADRRTAGRCLVALASRSRNPPG